MFEKKFGRNSFNKNSKEKFQRRKSLDENLEDEIF